MARQRAPWVSCLGCERTLVPARQWSQIPAVERERLRGTHRAYAGLGRCHTCWRDAKCAEIAMSHALAVPPSPDDAYTGGWRRRGLVLVPTAPGGDMHDLTTGDLPDDMRMEK